MLQILVARENWTRVLIALDKFHAAYGGENEPFLRGHTLFIEPQDVVDFFSIMLG